MEMLLLVLLIIIVLVALKSGKKDLLSPWFLVCLACLASYVIVLMNYKNWMVEINSKFALYVISALLAFALGVGFINAFSTRKQRAAVITLDTEMYTKSKYPTMLLATISLIASFIYIFKIVTDARVGIQASSFTVLLRAIYANIVVNNYTPGFVYNQLREIATAVAYVSMFRLLIKLYTPGDRISILGLAIPIILFVVMSLISSDRNIFLRFAIFSICVWVIVYRAKCRRKAKMLNNTAINVQIAINVSMIMVVVLLLFYSFGKAKQYTSNLERMLGIYGGSGLYNFNLWIKDFDGTLMHGKMTFSHLLSTLNSLFGRFGVNIESPSSDLKFIIFASSNGYVYSSNIYSAMIGFVMDFGYFGVILFPFIIGAIYQYLYNKAKCSNFFVLLYCLLIYAVIYFPIADQLFGRLHLGFVYEIFWFSMVYSTIYGKKKVRRYNMQKAKGGNLVAEAN